MKEPPFNCNDVMMLLLRNCCPVHFPQSTFLSLIADDCIIGVGEDTEPFAPSTSVFETHMHCLVCTGEPSSLILKRHYIVLQSFVWV